MCLQLRDPSRPQAATVRARSVKCLAAVVERDPRVLLLKDVKAGVDRCLGDEATSVREAALDLLGKHIAADRATAVSFFDLVARATADPGLSVRKRRGCSPLAA